MKYSVRIEDFLPEQRHCKNIHFHETMDVLSRLDMKTCSFENGKRHNRKTEQLAVMVINSIAGVAKADVTVLKEDSNRILGINTTHIIFHDKEILSNYVLSSCFG